jgi:hypothetical protein
MSFTSRINLDQQPINTLLQHRCLIARSNFHSFGSKSLDNCKQDITDFSTSKTALSYDLARFCEHKFLSFWKTVTTNLSHIHHQNLAPVKDVSQAVIHIPAIASTKTVHYFLQMTPKPTTWTTIDRSNQMNHICAHMQILAPCTKDLITNDGAKKLISMYTNLETFPVHNGWPWLIILCFSNPHLQDNHKVRDFSKDSCQVTMDISSAIQQEKK